MAQLYTANRDKDLVNMIAAEVRNFQQNLSHFKLLLIRDIGPRWYPKCFRANENLHLQTQQGWCTLS